MTLDISHSDDVVHHSVSEAIALELELLSEIDYREDPRPKQREGVAALQRLLLSFSEGSKELDPALIALVLIRLRDLQVRDFALGCMRPEDLTLHIEMWRRVVAISPHSFLAPVATILAAMNYEVGDQEFAHTALAQALDSDPEYPLALLLKRVFAASWPGETFATMRDELHPKITAAIFDE